MAERIPTTMDPLPWLGGLEGLVAIFVVFLIVALAWAVFGQGDE